MYKFSIRFLFLTLTLQLLSNHSYASKNMLLENFSSENKIVLSDTASILNLLKEAKNSYKLFPKKTILLLNNINLLSDEIDYQSGKANAYEYLGRIAYNTENYNISIENFNKSSIIYAQLNSLEDVANIGFRTALCYNSMGKLDSAISNYKKSLEIYKKINGNSRVSAIYTNLGIIYDVKGDYELAIDYYFKSYELDKFLKRKNVLAADLNNIGQLFETIELHDKAKEYLQKSINLSIESKDNKSLRYSYQSLATVYLNENRVNEALVILRKSLVIILKTTPLDIETLSLNYADLARVYLLKNNLDSAQFYLNKSYKYSNKLLYSQAYALVYQARLFNQRKAFYKARNTVKKGIIIADEIKSLPLKLLLLKELKISYENTKQFQKAFETQKLENSINSKLNSGRIIQKITALLLTIDFEKKADIKTAIRNKENIVTQNKLTNKNFFLSLFIIISLFTVIISIILFLNHKKQKVINELLIIKNEEISKNQSEIKLQSDALLELNQTKDKLFTIISHDLRKPISQLSSIINLLENNLLNREEIEYIIPSVSKNVKQTSELLDSLLFWAKSQMKGFTLKIKEIDLRNFADQNLTTLLSNAKEKNITFVNDIPQGLLIKLDLHLLNVVFRNLVNNAIKFSNLNSEITILYKEELKSYLITIKDSGAGMSEKQLKELFTPKSKSTLGTRNEVGSGLGLIFCKDLIEKSGGQISVKSVLNQGSEFSFSILKSQ